MPSSRPSSVASTLSVVDPAVLTGYLELTLLFALALFAGRKRLSMIPLGCASLWMTLHLLLGLLAAAV